MVYLVQALFVGHHDLTMVSSKVMRVLLASQVQPGQELSVQPGLWSRELERWSQSIMESHAAALLSALTERTVVRRLSAEDGPVVKVVRHGEPFPHNHHSEESPDMLTSFSLAWHSSNSFSMSFSSTISMLEFPPRSLSSPACQCPPW